MVIKDARNNMKRYFTLVLKGLYLLPFFLFGIWLLHQVYLSDVATGKYNHDAKPDPHKKVVGAILASADLVPRDHFHIIDKYITRPERHAPVCLKCHDIYAHSKNEKVRSILNFHNGFIACAVCHTRKSSNDGGSGFGFAWVDRLSGNIEDRADGAYGKYSAKIFTVSIAGNGTRRVVRPVDEKAAGRFLKQKENLSDEQLAQAQKKLHADIDEKPVACADCHNQDGYLDFAGLGFSPKRVVHLNSSEVVGLIDNYKTFYIPTELDFSNDGGEVSP